MANDANVNVKATITAEDKASKTIQGVGLSFGQMAGAVATGQAAFAAFTAVLHGVEDALKAVENVAKDSFKAAVDLDSSTLKLQRNFGLTAEQASGLIGVFGRFNISVDQISKGFVIFQKNLLDVADGESIGVKAITTLGVATTDGAGHLRNMSDVLGDVADKFKNGTVPATQAGAVAAKLFGRAGADLIPVLLQGKDGIAQLTEGLKANGLVINQDTINAYKNYAKQQADLNEKIQGFKVTLGNALMPAISQLITNINNWINANGGVQKIMQDRVIPIVKEVIQHVKDMITWVIQNKDTFIAFGEAIVAVALIIGGIIRGIAGVFHFFHDTVAGVIYNIINFFQKLPSAIAAAVKDLGGIIVAPFRWAFDEIKRGIHDVADTFNRVKNDISSAPGKVLSGFGKALHLPGFATGGFTGNGTINEVAGVVHKGEYVLPQSAVDQSTGMPKVTGVSPTINVTFNGIFTGNQIEMRKLAQKVFAAQADAQGMGTI